MKYSRFSLPRSVSDDLQILQVTYSTAVNGNPASALQRKLTNVFPQDVFDVLLCISTLHNQPLLTINRTLRSQFGVQELNDVFWLSVHSSTNVHEVREQSLLCSFTSDLWWHNGVSSLLTGEFGVVGVEKGEESSEQLKVSE